MLEEFEYFLRGLNLSENTVKSYLYALKQYESLYGTVSRKAVRDYKVFLQENYKPQTVNLRIRAINCYLESIQKEKWQISCIKMQQKTFLENVISEADYTYLKSCLQRDEEWFWYFVVRFLAATGARVSELVQIKVEDVQLGYLDIYSKGGKMRRIYIPRTLQKETRGIAGQLKHFAVRYQINPNVVYPHSFRHRFAKNFLEKYNDIALLADLMGHESIETTRIYLRKTSSEQQMIVDQVVDW